MSKLLKPTEYATLQGISRQAVYAKVKKGTLEAKTIDGKMYIVLDEIDEHEELEPQRDEMMPQHLIEVKELLSSKDQTISVLQESIADLKQTNTEINTTLRGEIELLKQVFTEMRNLYVKQIDYMVIEQQKEEAKQSKASIETFPLVKEEEHHDECWMKLETFFERSNIYKEKRKAKVLKRLRKAFRHKDERIKMYEGDIYLSCYHFYDDILT